MEYYTLQACSSCNSNHQDEVIRHLKVLPEEEIYIDPEVNEKIWERGIENPPRKIKLTVIRHDEPDIPIEVKLYVEA
jgi:large subunit ribosomal protein L31e